MATDKEPRAADPFAALTAALGEHAEHLELARQALAAHGAELGELRAAVAALLGMNEGKGPSPIPAPRWHELQGDERAAAIVRLRGWVRRVYVPVYGHLAAGLGACWEQHPLCCLLLDHLSETWAVLFDRPTRPQRVLSAQMEFQLRYLPAAADQLRTETAGCEHQAGRPLGGGRYG